MQQVSDHEVDLESFIRAILLGAAKILGCSSANLISFDKKTEKVRIQVGAVAARHAQISEIEAVLGAAFQRMAFSLKDVEGSLVAASWREQEVLETDSFAELVGRAFPRAAVAVIGKVLAENRFICVPVVGRHSAFGVIIFTKEDRHPFGRQHRELFLRYAQRVGEIVENELWNKGTMCLSGVKAPSPGVGGYALETHLVNFALGDAVPALLVDPEFRITSCNEAVRQHLGYSNEDLLGRFVEVLFKDGRSIRSILDHRILLVSNGYFEELTRIRHAGGQYVPAKVEVLLLADDENRVVGFLVLLRDKSYVRGDDDLGDDGLRLMRRERLATMGEMAAQLAHEIRNPLVSVGATLEMLAKTDAARPVDRGTLGELAREVTRVDTILQDYLSLSVRRNTSVAPVDLSSVIFDARRLLGRCGPLGGARFESSVEENLFVLGDYLGLRQVFINLLRNAFEASPDAGRVRSSALCVDDEVTVHIDDDGPGLEDSSLVCCQPFYTTKKNGTGLGLCVCQKIIEGHGGMLSLRNRREGGCRASVVLSRRRVSA